MTGRNVRRRYERLVGTHGLTRLTVAARAPYGRGQRPGTAGWQPVDTDEEVAAAIMQGGEGWYRLSRSGGQPHTRWTRHTTTTPPPD